MRQWFTVLLCTVMLTGCGYSESDLARSKAACNDRGGSFKTDSLFENSGSIHLTYCTYGGYQYTFDRFDGSYFGATEEGKVK